MHNSPAREKRIPLEVSTPQSTGDSDSTSVSSTPISTPLSTPTVATASVTAWLDTTLEELVQKDLFVTYPAKDPVDLATQIMTTKQLTCLPLTNAEGDVAEYLDYSHLNCYLLLVLGRVEPASNRADFHAQAEQVRKGIPSSAEFAAQLGAVDPIVRMPVSSALAGAVRQFASGVHRIACVDAVDGVVGVLSQRRMVKYIWTNIKKFPLLEAFLDKPLGELPIGTYQEMITVQGDAPLLDALSMMHDETVSSVAVVDREKNLLGNISVTDVSLLTRGAQTPLLSQSCKHFLTVILENRGLVDGKDVVPVFYVDRQTRLGLIIAKMVATKAHRLWIVEQRDSDVISSGRLVGVVSLTDILNFLARQGGTLLDPESARRHRRSSSSSVRSNSRARMGASPHSSHMRPSLHN